MRVVAYGLWYDDFVPSLSKFRGVGRRKAAYVVEFAVSNPLVDPTRRQRVTKQLEVAASKMSETDPVVPFYASESPTHPTRDALARKWRLASGMKPAKVKGLLDLQRRAHAEA